MVRHRPAHEIQRIFHCGGIAYTEYDVEGDIGLRREFYERGGRGTPLIFVRGQRMEGFDAGEFERLRRGRS